MPDIELLRELLAGAAVDEAVFALRPDYRVMLLAADDLVSHLTRLGPDVLAIRRLIAAGTPSGAGNRP